MQGLGLNNNQIGDKGVEELSKALVAIKCSLLLVLGLNNNQIGEKGVEELSKALVAIKCS